MYGHPSLTTAMCAALAPRESMALCFELPADGSAPEWVELIPAGPEVVGRDGRRWLFDRPEQVVAASLDGSRDIPLDWEHATELRAPKGETAPAAAWIAQLEVRDGALWGRVEWTERGRQSVAAREYRYLSPVFQFERESKRIARLTSAGLTNSPNLHLTALNRGEGPNDAPKENAMNEEQRKALCAALGLSESATVTDIMTALNRLQQERDTALNRAESPSLDKFVPRADYDQAQNRAAAAEQKLADQQKADQDKAIETAINSAIEAGKIAPASRDFYVAACRQEGGLENFQKFVESAPVIAADSGLDGKKPEGEDQGKALNAEQAKIAAMFGNSADDLAKYGADA